MRQMRQKGTVFLLVIVLLLSMQTTAFAAVSQSELESAVEQSAAYMLSAVKSPQVGSIGGEWAVIHRCRRCGTLSSNRTAADDNPRKLLSIAMKPVAFPPFPIERLEELAGEP